MSMLTVYNDDRAGERQNFSDFEQISEELHDIGVQFERWEANQPLDANADQEQVLLAYADAIDRLTAEYRFQSVDVIGLRPDHPDKAALRQKFLVEHTHDDFEVRFFVQGRGLFYLHADSKVYVVLCEQGDLISIPANTTHWFDMGRNPDFQCIRFFTAPDGWEANYTGDDIAQLFPSYDEFVSSVA